MQQTQDYQSACKHQQNGQSEGQDDLSTIESYQSYINQINQALEQSGQFTSQLRFQRYEFDGPSQKDEDEEEQVEGQEPLGEEFQNKYYGEQLYEQSDRISDNQQDMPGSIESKTNQLNPFCLHTIEEEEDQQHEEEVDINSKELTEVNSSPMKSNQGDSSEQQGSISKQSEFSGEKENNQDQTLSTLLMNTINKQNNLELQQNSEYSERVCDFNDQRDYNQPGQENIDTTAKQFVFIQGNKYHFMTIDPGNGNSAEKQTIYESPDRSESETDQQIKQTVVDCQEQANQWIQNNDERDRQNEELTLEEQQHDLIENNNSNLVDIQTNDLEQQEGQLKERMIVNSEDSCFENKQPKKNKQVFKGYLVLAQIHQQNKRRYEFTMKESNQVKIQQDNLIRKPKVHHTLQLDECFPDSPSWNQFKVSDRAASKLSQREESAPEVFDLFSIEETEQTKRQRDQPRFEKLNELIQDKLRKETAQNQLRMRQKQREKELEIAHRYKISCDLIECFNNNFYNTNKSILPLNENISQNCQWQLSVSDSSNQRFNDQYDYRNNFSLKPNNESCFQKLKKEPKISICNKDKIEQMTKELARQLEMKSQRKLESKYRMRAQKEDQIIMKELIQESCLKPKRISCTSRGNQRSCNSSQFQTSRYEEVDYQELIVPSNKRDKKNESEISITSSFCQDSFGKVGTDRLVDKNHVSQQKQNSKQIRLGLGTQGSFDNSNKQKFPKVKLKTLL